MPDVRCSDSHVRCRGSDVRYDVTLMSCNVQNMTSMAVVLSIVTHTSYG